MSTPDRHQVARWDTGVRPARGRWRRSFTPFQGFLICVEQTLLTLIFGVAFGYYLIALGGP